MPNLLRVRFCTGSPRPLGTFAPGQCIPAAAIMQFKRMSMNIQRKNSAHHFRMQSEREQTLVGVLLYGCTRRFGHPVLWLTNRVAGRLWEMFFLMIECNELVRK